MPLAMVVRARKCPSLLALSERQLGRTSWLRFTQLKRPQALVPPFFAAPWNWAVSFVRFLTEILGNNHAECISTS